MARYSFSWGLALLCAGPCLFPVLRLDAQLTPAALRPPPAPSLREQFDSDKARAQASLDSGRFAEAARQLEALVAKSPDDLDLQYLLAQSYRRQGKYQEAERVTQWMLDLRPEFPGALWEAALLREQFQDLSGAVELLNEVYHRTPATKTKTRVSVLEDLLRIFEKQKNQKDSAILRREIARLKGLNQ